MTSQPNTQQPDAAATTATDTTDTKPEAASSSASVPSTAEGASPTADKPAAEQAAPATDKTEGAEAGANTEKSSEKSEKKPSFDSPEEELLSVIRGKTVLLAEDNLQIRKLITSRLKHLGAVVETAENGKIAWEMLTLKPDFKPDVVLMDMMMPEMNGVELLGQMRKSTTHRNVPVIVVSARRDRKLVILLMRIGIQGYIVKPLKVGEALMRIAEVIRDGTSIKLGAPL